MKQTVDACGYVVSAGCQRVSVAFGVAIHILREASAGLLVLLYRAMRRPQQAERVNGTTLAHFHF